MGHYGTPALSRFGVPTLELDSTRAQARLAPGRSGFGPSSCPMTPNARQRASCGLVNSGWIVKRSVVELQLDLNLSTENGM